MIYFQRRERKDRSNYLSLLISKENQKLFSSHRMTAQFYPRGETNWKQQQALSLQNSRKFCVGETVVNAVSGQTQQEESATLCKMFQFSLIGCTFEQTSLMFVLVTTVTTFGTSLTHFPSLLGKRQNFHHIQAAILALKDALQRGIIFPAFLPSCLQSLLNEFPVSSDRLFLFCAEVDLAEDARKIQ